MFSPSHRTSPAGDSLREQGEDTCLQLLSSDQTRGKIPWWSVELSNKLI